VPRPRLCVGVSSNVKRIRTPTQSRGRGTQDGPAGHFRRPALQRMPKTPRKTGSWNPPPRPPRSRLYPRSGGTSRQTRSRPRSNRLARTCGSTSSSRRRRAAESLLGKFRPWPAIFIRPERTSQQQSWRTIVRRRGGPFSPKIEGGLSNSPPTLNSRLASPRMRRIQILVQKRGLTPYQMRGPDSKPRLVRSLSPFLGPSGNYVD